MRNLRKHGKKPFTVAVVHGGPGANGEMEPVARELSASFGVLEPLQTARTIQGQIDELKSVLDSHGTGPMTLIGHSWGAWLTFVLAAQYPRVAEKIILVGSGPFEIEYKEGIMKTRLSRLSASDRKEALALRDKLADYPRVDQRTLDKFVNLISKGDNYDPVAGTNVTDFKYHLYQSIWPEADAWRRSGKLIRFGKKIRCPVIAIHGDYDPHPYQGVKKPLSRTVADFEFVLLKKCGHSPWNERHMSGKFYRLLRGFISGGKRI